MHLLMHTVHKKIAKKNQCVDFNPLSFFIADFFELLMKGLFLTFFKKDDF